MTNYRYARRAIIFVRIAHFAQVSYRRVAHVVVAECFSRRFESQFATKGNLIGRARGFDDRK